MNGNMPWFPFFAADWLLSRKKSRMSLPARGLYADMLAHQWLNGPLPDDPGELAAMLGVDVLVIHTHWPELSPCFERCASGLVNDKLEEVRDEQIRKAERLSRAGKAAAEAKKARRR